MLRFGAKTCNVLPIGAKNSYARRSSLFLWLPFFAMVFMCLMVLAEFYLVLYDSCFHIAHGSLNSFDGFLMVLIVFSFNHSLILGDVGRF